MIRFNVLKIFILANEAKPGGLIGAMLAPYLFSTNMTDFCKRFNEQSKDYLNTIWLGVNVKCDIVEKTYLFFIKEVSMSLVLSYFFSLNSRITINQLFDVVLYYSGIYKINFYKMALLCFSILRSLKKKYYSIVLGNSLQQKIDLNV